MMKPETLQSLLMDREMSELSPEVTELLDAYLAANPSARREAEAVARTVQTTRETVRRFPELAARDNRVVSFAAWFSPWLARAAALIVVAGAAAWLGYRAGRPPVAPVARTEHKQFEGLWTQYNVAYDARGAVTIVSRNP
jgi:hypothetical protein